MIGNALISAGNWLNRLAAPGFVQRCMHRRKRLRELNRERSYWWDRYRDALEWPERLAILHVQQEAQGQSETGDFPGALSRMYYEYMEEAKSSYANWRDYNKEWHYLKARR